MLIKTKNGSEAELKDFITGREFRAIRNLFFSAMKSKGNDVVDFELDATLEAEEKTIEMIVVSLNGSKEDVLNKVLDLPREDYEEIMEKVNEIYGGLKKKKK